MPPPEPPDEDVVITQTPSTWKYVCGVVLVILYVLFVVYLCIWALDKGQSDIALITLISSINLPILGPVLVWIFLISDRVSNK